MWGGTCHNAIPLGAPLHLIIDVPALPLGLILWQSGIKLSHPSIHLEKNIYLAPTILQSWNTVDVHLFTVKNSSRIYIPTTSNINQQRTLAHICKTWVLKSLRKVARWSVLYTQLKIADVDIAELEKYQGMDGAILQQPTLYELCWPFCQFNGLEEHTHTNRAVPHGATYSCGLALG